MAWWLLLWLITVFIFASGVYYIASIKSHDSKKSQRNKNFIGVILIAISFICFIQSYKATFMSENMAEKTEDLSWYSDFSLAKNQAILQNKNIFIDFGAKWCSICKAIESTVLVKPEIKKVLEQNFILLKVDGTNSNSEPYASLHKEYNITGFPTLLVIEPESGKVLKKYMGEFYDLPTNQIVKELEKLS